MHGLNQAPTPVLAERAPFRLGDVEVVPATRRVQGPQGETMLEPRVMQVLLALADAGGAVRTREALERQCWEGLYVSEDALTRAIGEIRRALRLAGSDRVQLETIPKTGYRLVVATADQDDALESPPEALNDNSVSIPRRAVSLGAVALLAASSAGFWAWRKHNDPTTARVEELKRLGWDSWRLGLPDAQMQGEGFLREAVGLAPDDAGAFGLLALLRRNIAEMADGPEAQAALGEAERMARRALSLDPREGNALAARALLLPEFGDWLGMRARLQTALALAPSNVPARDAMGLLSQGTGMVAEAAGIAETLAQEDPLAAVLQYKLVYRRWIVGKVREADRAADRAMELWPAHPAVWYARMWTFGYTGRAEEALRMIRAEGVGRFMSPSLEARLSSTMTALASRRPVDVARAIDLNRAAAVAAPGAAVMSVQHLAALGDIDGAFEAARGYLVREGSAIGSLTPDPKAVPNLNQQFGRKTMMLFIPPTAPMRADPRFLRLAEDMGMADYWARAGLTPDFMRR